jgi:hypothetical protein
MSGFIQMTDGKIVIGGPVNIGANGPTEDVTIITDEGNPSVVVWLSGDPENPLLDKK